MAASELRATEILAFEPRVCACCDASDCYECDHEDECRRSAAAGHAIVSRMSCPYCRSDLGAETKDKALASNAFYDIKIKHCDVCGWWCTEQASGVMEGGEKGYLVINSILREFRTSDLDVPVRELRGYLGKHPNALYELHPRKFEELIAAVFSDFFRCEVELTAQTRDGGVDMYLIRSDGTYLVQAKRRSDPRAIEGVQAVRELAGVLLTSGYTKGIVVSTAQDFSKPAKREAASPFLNSQGYLIELINGRRLLEALHVVKQRHLFEPIWRELLKTPFEFSSMRNVLYER